MSAAAGGAPDPQVMRRIGELIRARQISRAIELALPELERGAEHPQLLHLRSTWHQSQGRPREALADLERARELGPKELPVLMALGETLAALNRRLEAREAFESAARLRPDLAGPAVQVAWVSEGMGKIDEARAAYAEALKLDPRHAYAMGRLAVIATQQGEWRQAREHARRALAVDSHEFTAHLALIRAAIHEGRLDEAETRLTAVRRQRLSPEEAYLAGKELGALRHRQARHPEAFAAWGEANDIAHRHFAPLFGGQNRAAAVMRWIADHFEKEPVWAATPKRAAPSPVDTHVFLLGFARSGTTLLEQVLAAHPDVVAMEEKEAFVAALDHFRLTPDGYRALRDATDEQLAPFRAAYWREAAAYGYEPTRRVFLDKSPFNTSRLPLIARLFPDAKVLFALRDPRDVVLSCFRTPFRTVGVTYELLKIEDAGRFYAAFMEAGRVFCEKLPLDVLEVRHENLLDDLEGGAREICEFIGLDLRPEMLRFEEAQRRVATPSAHQLRAGLNRTSAGQWRNYAKQMAPALTHLAPWVARFGYPE